MQSGIDTDRINGLVNRLIELTEQGVEFSVDQLPELAGEIVMWGIASNLLIACSAAIAGLIASLVFRRLRARLVVANEAFQKAIDDDTVKRDLAGNPVRNPTDAEDCARLCMAVCMPIFIAAPFVFVACAYRAAQPVVAPRLYIIEYLQGML